MIRACSRDSRVIFSYLSYTKVILKVSLEAIHVSEMKLHAEDTPPSSVNGDEISVFDEDELIYVGDADEVLEMAENELLASSDEEEESEPVKDDSKYKFETHNGSVFCGSLHPNGNLAVTGGEDDEAFVWNVESGEIVTKCTKHKDSIIFADFSFDGAYLATVDMGGGVNVWKCNLDSTEPWPIAWEYETGDLIWGKWHAGSRVLIVGSSDGEIFIFRIPSGETKVLQGNNVKSECGVICADGKRLAVGYEDGSTKVWDMKSGAVLHNITVESNILSPVTSLDAHADNNLLITGFSNGKILLTATGTGKRIGLMDSEDDLETVAFSKDPELGYFATGTLSGDVSIWELSRQMLRHKCSKSGTDSPGVTNLLWVNNYLICGCLDGSVRVYEGRSGEHVITMTGHQSEILDLKYSAQKRILLTTSDDGSARIFDLSVLEIENK